MKLLVQEFNKPNINVVSHHGILNFNQILFTPNIYMVQAKHA